jgi:hypothetical protein
MTKLGDIELTTIGKYLAIGGMVVWVLLFCGLTLYDSGHLDSIFETKTVQATTAPTAVPTVALVPSYPSVITFTVLSTTTSSGRYQILTTAGQILYCNNYYAWNGIEPQNSYTATVTGTDGSAYIISDPVLIAQHYSSVNYGNNYPQYYSYNGRYYQTDGKTIDEVSWKQVYGEKIIYGKPCAGNMICG